MSLFICVECGCVDNTATSGYWVRVKLNKQSALCSACNPDVEQHHHFPLIPWDGKRDVLNPPTPAGEGETNHE